MKKKRCVCGVDLGGTKTATALIDFHGNIHHKTKKKTDVSDGAKSVMAGIVGMIRDEFEYADNHEMIVNAIGMGSGGCIDKDKGVVSYATSVFPGWIGMPIKDILQKEFDVPVSIDNDGKVTALGEGWIGAAKGVENFVCIAVGTGVTSGIVISGELYRGYGGYAGEIGHASIEMNGVECDCGNYGCLDAYVGASSIIKRVTKALKKGVKTKINDKIKGDLANVTPQTVFESAQEGDEFALSVLAEVSKYLGVGIANLINTLNPELIVLSGGLAQAGELLLKFVRPAVKQRINVQATGQINIKLTKLGEEAGVIGAAALAITNMEQS
ncbi:MAG TPA: ROK family protein [Anaerolineae bacterium]|nr:ROK family protein [Anaerolineae bacterium]